MDRRRSRIVYILALVILFSGGIVAQRFSAFDEIDKMYRAFADRILIYLMRGLVSEHHLPLEVNPTSNLCLRIYPSYQAHPLRQLLEAGVCVTINSDDPALFNTTLNDEYLHAVQDCGLSVSQLEQAALNAVRASYLPADEKQGMLETFQQEYARLRPLYSIDGAQVDG